MKRILVCMLFLGSYISNAQLHVDGKNLNAMEITYISIERDGGLFEWQNGSVCYDTDETVRGHCRPITDEGGKVIKFAKQVAMLEYVSQRGWKYMGNIDRDLGEGLAMLFVKRTDSDQNMGPAVERK